MWGGRETRQGAHLFFKKDPHSPYKFSLRPSVTVQDATALHANPEWFWTFSLSDMPLLSETP